MFACQQGHLGIGKWLVDEHSADARRVTTVSVDDSTEIVH